MCIFLKIIVMFTFFTADIPKAEVTVIPSSNESRQTKMFIDQKLSKNGGVYTNYNNYKSIGNITKGHDVLSESQGLYMLYSVYTNDKESFDKSFNFLAKKMMLKNGLVSWRTVNNKKDKASSLIDDLRIVEALYYAYSLWGDDNYKYYLIKISAGIVNQYPVLRNFQKSSEINLSYLNIKAIKIVAMIFPKWSKNIKTAENILNNGYISDTYPLYYEKYNFKSQKYENLDILQSIIAHLNSEDKTRKKKFINWLEENLSKGNSDVLRINGVESTAVYSLTGELALEVGNTKVADIMKEKIDQFKINNNKDFSGSFGFLETKEFFSFDNLTAMMFLNSGGY